MGRRMIIGCTIESEVGRETTVALSYTRLDRIVLSNAEMRPRVMSSTSENDSQDDRTPHQPAHTELTSHGDSSSSFNTIQESPSLVPSAVPSMLLPSSVTLPMISGSVVIPGAAGNNSIPEFLYQLTKMLTDNNREIIEWSNGMIEVHNPHKLESHVLQKYFRHSKFASFQRQLNYFGFRKLAGKGKMAPCSYVNESATDDIASLLLIKRKTTPVPTTKEKLTKPKRRDLPDRIRSSSVKSPSKSIVSGISKRTRDHPDTKMPAAAVTKKNVHSISGPEQQQALAQSAVGRGIRHGFSLSAKPDTPTSGVAHGSLEGESLLARSACATTAALQTTLNLPDLSTPEDCLSQLVSNYRNTLNELASKSEHGESEAESEGKVDDERMEAGATFPLFLSRDNSLVDLAMLPTGDDDIPQPMHVDGESDTDVGLSFIDFPNPEVDPSLRLEEGKNPYG